MLGVGLSGRARPHIFLSGGCFWGSEIACEILREVECFFFGGMGAYFLWCQGSNPEPSYTVGVTANPHSQPGGESFTGRQQENAGRFPDSC